MEQRSLRTGLWPDDKRLGLAARHFCSATNSVLGCTASVFHHRWRSSRQTVWATTRRKRTKLPRQAILKLHSHHAVMTSVANEQPIPMPYTCIRPLVARQLALPAWFFSPPPAAC